MKTPVEKTGCERTAESQTSVRGASGTASEPPEAPPEEVSYAFGA